MDDTPVWDAEFAGVTVFPQAFTLQDCKGLMLSLPKGVNLSLLG